jgi:hypothetical protein
MGVISDALYLLSKEAKQEANDLQGLHQSA